VLYWWWVNKIINKNMARRKLEERNTRKLSKKSNGSYSVTLPVEAVRDLEWKKGQKLVVRKSGSKIIIEDWEK
jgi:hypothetical protein